MQPGEVPAQLLLAEPRNVDNTPRIAMAWSSEGAFTGRIVAQIEFGFGFAPGPLFTLQHNGAPGSTKPRATKRARSTSRCAMPTASSCSRRSVTTTWRSSACLFGVDLYPPDVSPRATDRSAVPGCRRRALLQQPGVHRDVRLAHDAPPSRPRCLIPRADPARLTYDVLTQPSADARIPRDAWPASAAKVERWPRGPARMYDFPTARVKVRGCNACRRVRRQCRALAAVGAGARRGRARLPQAWRRTRIGSR